jgi:hypothetical protein
MKFKVISQVQEKTKVINRDYFIYYIYQYFKMNQIKDENFYEEIEKAIKIN